MLRKMAVAMPFVLLSKIKLCAVNTGKIREWNFSFFEKFMLSVLSHILLTQVLLKCASSLQACHVYRRELVLASPEKPPNKEKLQK